MCITPITVKSKGGKYIPAPCGKCAECLNKFRLQWFIRLKEHIKNYDETSFVTFTYSDENLPKVVVDESTGEYYTNSLDPRHMQLYFKSLRQSLGDKRISYYLVGEYGTDTLRPHYHAIIFGAGKDDIEKYAKHWTYGFIYVGSVTDASINYVCKYHLLRSKNPVGAYPSFSRMSKGIGADYIIRSGERISKDPDRNMFYWLNGKKVNMPRYYREKLLTEKQKVRYREKTRKEYEIKMLKESTQESVKNYWVNKRYQINQKNDKLALKSKKSGKI